MALIKCPECGIEVSEKAAACPKCANPISKVSQSSTSIVELTSKKLKKHNLFASLIFIIGFMFLFIGGTEGFSSIIALILIVIGLIWFFMTKISIWWQHK